MRFRYEHKYLINAQTAALLQSRAAGIMEPDSYADDKGGYTVNNIYLDDRYDSFYLAKEMGQFQRDKYRIRYYNGDLSFIRLERKHKEGILNYKETLPITPEQLAQIKKGDLTFALTEPHPLWQKLATLHRLRHMQPRAIFSYRRETLTYKPATVRLTLDSPLFDSGEKLHMPPFPRKYVKFHSGRPYNLLLEVKYSGFLPEIIQQLLNGLPLVHTEMSKYSTAREQAYLPQKQIKKIFSQDTHQ